jgi:hypothetical protein
MSPITSLRLLVADLRHAELYLLGCKFVVRQSHVRAYPKHLVAFSSSFYILQSRILPTVAITERTR